MTYPCSPADGQARLLELEGILMDLDRLLARYQSPLQESLRVLFGAEYDRLYDALETLPQVRHLPICVCGKRSHAEQAGAGRHLSMLATLGRSDPRPARTYRCFLSGVWHVGHYGEFDISTMEDQP